jgi:hypothetical protein
MTMHLNKFIERVQGHEARGARDFMMSMADAKNMHADLTKLLLELNQLRETRQKDKEEAVINVVMDGGNF